MNYKQTFAILLISSVLGATPVQAADFQQSYNQGVQKLAQGNFNGAIAEFDKVVQSNPKYSEAYCLRGQAKAQLGDIRGALPE